MTAGKLKGAEWSTYWSGRARLEGGSAYVGAGVERDADLTRFWEERLLERPVESRLLDLACGAGAVVRHAVGVGFYEVLGLDISPDAISLMKESFPSATGVIGSAHQIPLPDAAVDIVVSQFGFEYAGVSDTLPEIHRVLAPGGQFLALVHMTEGVIASECRRHLAEARAFEETRFTSLARDVFIAASRLSGAAETRTEYEAAVSNMKPSQQALSHLAQNGHALAAHVLSGVGRMFQRRQNYALEDITDWLDRVEAENEAHIRRMSGMLDAALDQSEADAAVKTLTMLGLREGRVSALRVGPDNEAVGWIMEARKPGG